MDDRLASLPNLLVDQNGESIKTIQQWQEKRRPEILHLFRDYVYGKEPINRPDNITFETTFQTDVLNGLAQCKQITINFSGTGGDGKCRLLLYIPHTTKGPVPTFLLLDNKIPDLKKLDEALVSERWPAKDIISRGYATAILQTDDIDPDFHDGFQNGVHGIFDPSHQSRPKHAWGTIAAWAWGASRAMDYFETDSNIDEKRVAVVGHSRWGKTALWAGAKDERFAMVVSNNSGNTGAAISRGKKGETIRQINTNFPHWFTDNYKAFNDKEYDMPFDQHMLLSLIAPRLLYVSSATEDDWADPESEFLSLSCACESYHIFDSQGVHDHSFPSPDKPIVGDRVGYHLRTGEHDLLKYDWMCFLDFADGKL